jgi:hypothetical protein
LADRRPNRRAARGGGPTATRIYFVLALMCLAILFAAALLA